MAQPRHAHYGLMMLVMGGGSWRVICQISTLNYLLLQSKIVERQQLRHGFYKSKIQGEKNQKTRTAAFEGAFVF